MKTLSRILVAVILLAIAGLGAFLATWDNPPPGGKIESVLPDDRFPR